MNNTSWNDTGTRCPVTAVWLGILNEVFSTMGRLARLAACHNPRSDHYGHHDLTEYFGAAKADRALRTTHELVWESWISGSLEQQYADILSYLHDLARDAEQVITLCSNTNTFVTFPPSSVSEQKRNLFLITLKQTFTLLWDHYPAGDLRGLVDSERTRSLNIQDVVAQIQEQYRDPELSLKDLSGRTGMSAEYLGRRFKKTTGQTFHCFVRNLRIEHAAGLVINSFHDMKNIAAMVGYADRSRFSKHFRMLKGCSPLEFRHKHVQDNADEPLVVDELRAT